MNLNQLRDIDSLYIKSSNGLMGLRKGWFCRCEYGCTNEC